VARQLTKNEAKRITLEKFLAALTDGIQEPQGRSLIGTTRRIRNLGGANVSNSTGIAALSARILHRGSTNTEPAVVATGRMLDYGHQLCQRPLLGIDAILS